MAAPLSRAPQPHASVHDVVMKRWAEVKRDGRLTSVRELCRAANISPTTWYALQGPDSRPARNTVTGLAHALDLAVDDLLRLAGYRGTLAAHPVVHTPSPAGANER